MTAGELFGGNNPLGKDYPGFDSLAEPAKTRLSEILLDDLDGLSRLRLSGRKRLFGVRRHNEFSILWWDPEHEVAVSVKKHT